jgi:hypothetical protein
MDNNSIDLLILVIRVFPRRIFQLPIPIPIVENENPPNFSPDLTLAIILIWINLITTLTMKMDFFIIQIPLRT